ncbi:DUF2591 domain-containing protein [Variovorax sp. S2]|uniref:DUF2591 domain-containing protein n=1 Tax=Variovorax sp. S12S4 TaxID=3029170 RepID=UPI00215CA73B|nr:DUF2591 domain-containing protein [Variovorax sp. S12S4]MCR8961160.1 DUF2591 domain-containing protein [Variovorax sp. S12S4]
MQVDELEAGAVLNYWVGRAEGWDEASGRFRVGKLPNGHLLCRADEKLYAPSDDLCSGAEIVRRNRIAMFPTYVHEAPGWHGRAKYSPEIGLTPRRGDFAEATDSEYLIAAMRTRVKMAFGDSVPEEVAKEAFAKATPFG